MKLLFLIGEFRRVTFPPSTYVKTYILFELFRVNVGKYTLRHMDQLEKVGPTLGRVPSRSLFPK